MPGWGRSVFGRAAVEGLLRIHGRRRDYACWETHSHARPASSRARASTEADELTYA